MKLVEHCTSIPEVMGLNPIQARILFRSCVQIAAMINYILISFFTVQINEISYIYL